MLTLVAAVALSAMAEWGKPYRLTEITDPQVKESSGLAASRRANGVFYTHNDSGDTARFFRFDKKGRVTASFLLRGARAIDWEDMASATVRGTHYLYLGDTGDNARKRENIQVYRVQEPDTSAKGGELGGFDTFTISYSDQARDCEAMFVQPLIGDIWFVSKAREGVTVVYRVENPTRTGVYTAERMGTVAVNTGGLGGTLVTGADASPDGRYVVLRTYTGALVYPIQNGFENWFKETPEKAATASEAQGEGICFSRDSKSWLTSSEGSPCPISVSPKVR